MGSRPGTAVKEMKERERHEKKKARKKGQKDEELGKERLRCRVRQ